MLRKSHTCLHPIDPALFVWLHVTVCLNMNIQTGGRSKWINAGNSLKQSGCEHHNFFLKINKWISKLLVGLCVNIFMYIRVLKTNEQITKKTTTLFWVEFHHKGICRKRVPPDQEVTEQTVSQRYIANIVQKTWCVCVMQKYPTNIQSTR